MDHASAGRGLAGFLLYMSPSLIYVNEDYMFNVCQKDFQAEGVVLHHRIIAETYRSWRFVPKEQVLRYC